MVLVTATGPWDSWGTFCMRAEDWGQTDEERRKTRRKRWIVVSSEETVHGTWPSGIDDF